MLLLVQMMMRILVLMMAVAIGNFNVDDAGGGNW